METLNKDSKTSRNLIAGMIMIAIGVIFSMKNFGLYVPNWIFSWHTILLAIGLWMGYKKKFTVDNWVVLVLIGGIFTLRDLFFDLSRFSGAFILIGIGIYLIIKPVKLNSRLNCEKGK